MARRQARLDRRPQARRRSKPVIPSASRTRRRSHREARDAAPQGAAAVHRRLRRRPGRRGQARPAVIGITAAMAGGTGLNKLAERLPEQYYDVGIAEQDAVLFASGLAIQGAKPVCAIYSTFLQRAFDQIVHDVCLQKLNVVFAMDRAGPGRRRRADAPRLLRHLLLPPAAERGRDGAARRGHAGPHAAHRPRPRRRPDRLPLPARDAEGVADARPPRAIEIGKGEILLQGDASRCSATARASRSPARGGRSSPSTA